ncbi:MAG: hypothetical protein IKU51_05920 [Clostridia bacterium]|nr:hypothetical protein [Clostridia bacterium]
MIHDREPLPTYDRKRLEVLVMEHRLRVHRTQKKSAGSRKRDSGVKAPR